MKPIRFLIAIALLPAAWSVTRALIALCAATADAGNGDISRQKPLIAFIAGTMLCIILLGWPRLRPTRLYILSHEITHALWGGFMGADLVRFRAGRENGSVTLTKSNTLIALAPYFFPLLTVMAAVTYAVAGLFFDLSANYLTGLFLIGMTWGFHADFTVRALLRGQSDIRACGYLISYTLIWLINMLFIQLCIATLSPVPLATAAEVLGRYLAESYTHSYAAIKMMILRQ